MKLTAFQAGKGDCLLLETADGHHRMLIDGGVEHAYTDHIAAALHRLHQAGKSIDVVYVSHIDDDHIAGVLQLLDDTAAWRIHDHLIANGNPGHPEPDNPRPPDIGRIWHNGFHDQVGRNSGPIQDMLAQTAVLLSGSDAPEIAELATERRELATSVPQALRVSRRISGEQLNIALNPEFNGKLMMIDDDAPTLSLGSIKLTILGPFRSDLKALRDDWNTWLRDHQAKVKEIRDTARIEGELIAATDIDRVLGPRSEVATKLAAAEIEAAKKLGRRSEVTVPNLASLTFLAVDDEHSLLLTGDAHSGDILKGLEHQNALDGSGTIHVDILKVQHHGSEHNIDQTFCDTVTATNYVFCGNGEHQNPDLDVLKLIVRRRLANDTRPFRFWFTSTSTLSHTQAGRTHMKRVEDAVSQLETDAGGRLTSKSINGHSIRIRA